MVTYTDTTYADELFGTSNGTSFMVYQVMTISMVVVKMT